MTRRPSARQNVAPDAPAQASGRGAKRLKAIALGLFALMLVQLAVGAVGSFVFAPADGVLSVCAVVALVHAGVFSWALETARRRLGGSIGGPPPRGVSSLGAVLFLGAFVFVVAWLTDGMLICGHLNEITGDRSIETATVEAKTHATGKGCHFHLYVHGQTIESGTSLCVDEAVWRPLDVGDHLPLTVVNGRLGQSVSLVANAPGGTHE